MDLAQFVPGSVRRRKPGGGGLIRVLSCSDDMVQYDAWWPGSNSWGMQDLKLVRRKAFSYYTVPLTTLDRISEFVRSEPLSPEEEAVHRPDLPFTAARSNAQTWLTVEAGDVDGPGKLMAADLVLRLFSASGGSGPKARVQAADGSGFMPGELVMVAKQLLAPVLKGNSPIAGVGIHRLGLLRGVPSYYLWGPRWAGAID